MRRLLAGARPVRVTDDAYQNDVSARLSCCCDVTNGPASMACTFCGFTAQPVLCSVGIEVHKDVALALALIATTLFELRTTVTDDGW